MSEPLQRSQIANQLLSLIRPYYKGLRLPDSRPEFKKSLKGDEVENLLLSLHDIIVELTEKEGENGNS